ncbi:hypothetical protein DOY81_008038 [Sarcophaga bullata]|nr:hypothetical protein DOY81_008038 [Sarcophaga bullata]
MALSRDLIRLILACVFIGISMAKENMISNEISPLKDNQLTEKYKDVVGDFLKLQLDLDTLQSRLHLQSELINSIRARVLKTDTTSKQCKISEHFNEIEYRLHRMKQNLIRLMNNNNDKHLDKIETILFKMQTFRVCSDEKNNAQLWEEIKTRLSNTETKITEFFKRLETLETTSQDISKPQQEYKESIDSIVNQIHTKLEKQENILQKLNQPLSDLPKTSAYILPRHCHGNCIIKRLLEADKKLSVEKQKEKEN